MNMKCPATLFHLCRYFSKKKGTYWIKTDILTPAVGSGSGGFRGMRNNILYSQDVLSFRNLFLTLFF